MDQSIKGNKKCINREWKYSTLKICGPQLKQCLEDTCSTKCIYQKRGKIPNQSSKLMPLESRRGRIYPIKAIIVIMRSEQ